MNNYFQQLDSLGLQVFLAGANFNFRTAIIGEEAVGQQMTKALHEGKFDYSSLFTGEQVHGQRVAYPLSDKGEPFSLGRIIPQTDGLITDQAKQVLMVKFADCTPVIIYDVRQKVVAIVHSGWRSTVKKISQLAVKEMQNRFKSKVEDMWVYIGPSIDQANYEVGEEVYHAFSNWEHHELFVKPGDKPNKYYLSMIDANLLLIRAIGIGDERIMIDKRSTYLESDLHSARQEGKEYQLNGLFVMIKD